MASGAGIDKEVGRLSIRVVPDMTGFREEVRAGALGAGKDIEVPVDADTSKARRKIEEVTNEKYDMRIDLDADGKGLRAKVHALAKEAELGEKIKIKVEADTFGLDLAKKRIDRFLTDESLDIGRAQQRLANTMREWSPQAQARRDLADMEQRIQLKPRMDEHEIEEMRLRLAHENFTIKVKMQRDEASLHNLMQSAEGDLDRIFNKHLGDQKQGNFLSRLMDRGGNAISNFKAPDLVPNIGGLGAFGSIGIIVAGLSLLAPALALVSQALVGLPALVAGFALPLGVFALGFKGVKKALDDSGILKDEQKFDKDGKPKGKAKQGLGSVLSELQTNVSDVFATGLKPVFQQIAGVIPQLTRGLPFVAQGLVKMAEGLGNVLATPAFTEGFDRFTNSVGTMLTNLSPALQLFTSAMSNLIVNVGDHLPGLANTMTEWAGQFQNWVGKISKPKQDWFGKEVPGSSELDTAISNMKPVLNGIKDFVGNLLEKGLQLAGDPNLIRGITDFLTGLEHLAEQVARMGPVFEGLATILKLIPSSDKPDPNAPYGTKPGPTAGSPAVPVTHEEAMNQKVGFVDDPVQWIGDKAKDFLGHMFDGAKKFVTEQTIGGNLISMLLGGGTPTANAAPEPFNAGKPLAPGSPPVPVQIVQGPSTAGLFPGGPGNPIQPHPPAPVAPIAPGGSQGEIKAPKIEVPKLPPGSEKIWEPLIASTQAAAGQVNGSISAMVGQIQASLQGLGPAGNAAGVALGTGLAGGIAASAPAALAAAQALGSGVAAALAGPFGIDAHSPSKKSHKSGQDFAQGFDDGMSEGFQGVVSKAQELAQRVSETMQESGVVSPELKGQIGRELQAIGIQYDRLKQSKESLDPKDKTGRAGIQAQMKQLQDLRTELGLDSKESKYNSQFGGKGSGSDSTSQAASMITQALASGLDALKGMAMANVSQLQTDLGMSGNGAVEKLADYGIGFLSSAVNSVAQGAFGGGQGGNTYNFQSMDHDGTMKNYERVKTRESMEHTQRSN
jgi:hypothetical protein